MARITLKHISLVSVLLTLTISGILLSVVGTATKEINAKPILSQKSARLPQITATSAYVFDVETQMPLYSYNENLPRPIASVTKLLSSALFYEFASSTASTTVTWGDVRTEGRSGRLKAGQEYQNSMFLFPALLESSNDASAVMQRVIPIDLVAQMNTYAQKQGLTETSFADASGLSDNNISTAKELGILSVALKNEYPYIFDITRLKTYLNHINAWMNNNPFVRDEAYRGGKHGYTTKANRTAIAFFEEELQTGQKRVVGYVLLGSEALQTDMERLRTYVVQSVVLE